MLGGWERLALLGASLSICLHTDNPRTQGQGVATGGRMWVLGPLTYNELLLKKKYTSTEWEPLYNFACLCSCDFADLKQQGHRGPRAPPLQVGYRS